MVEDLFAVRGIIVSHQTVRSWAEKFGRQFAADIRRRSAGQFDGKWHLDEVVITIAGKKHWLWRAVDQDGFVLDAIVQSRRNTALLHGSSAVRPCCIDRPVFDTGMSC